jgi:hypothetical protein
VDEREVVEVLGETYIALRNTLEIQLNYHSDHLSLQSSDDHTTNISLAI